MNPFSIRLAMADAQATVRARFGPMLAILMLFYVAIIGLTMVLGGGVRAMAVSMASGGASAGVGGAMFLFYLLFYALSFAQQAAMIRVCSDRHPGTIGDALEAGVRSVPTLLAIAVLAFVAMLPLAIVVGMVVGGLAAALQTPAMGVVLALLALVVGAYLAGRLSMLLPVVAIDEVRNPLRAIGNAWRMSEGNALRIVALFVGATLLFAVVAAALFALIVGIPGTGVAPAMGKIFSFVVVILVLAIAFTFYVSALIAAAHRQLAGTSAAAISDAFA